MSVKGWGEGHIHETFLVETKDHNPDYILQKINKNIFKNIPGMMSNIDAVTRHARKKLTGYPGMDTITLVQTRSGDSFFIDENEDYWRMFIYIPGTVTHQNVTGPEMAFEAGTSIGSFQAMLADLETPLIKTIPDFHNINLRISQYEQAKAGDPAGRAASIPADLDFVEVRFKKMMSYLRSLQENAVTRATHNDTKLNNILFNRENKAICLIDLDTVMPGFVHFDYGDALRTLANTAAEDEKDLSKVHFNLAVYHAFTRGYLETAGKMLSKSELDLLPYAPVYLTFIIGLRFLTDYLNGDVYFRIDHPEHNLERARVQFRLVEEIERQ
jgi:Ser/Thr protein kinase RdoA (MazF antagonist)